MPSRAHRGVLTTVSASRYPGEAQLLDFMARQRSKVRLKLVVSMRRYRHRMDALHDATSPMRGWSAPDIRGHAPATCGVGMRWRHRIDED